MMLFHPWILEGLGILLLAVGVAGLVSPVPSPSRLGPP